MKRSPRCIQCQRTVPFDRAEIVMRGDERILLHGGGCPKPDPVTGTMHYRGEWE